MSIQTNADLIVEDIQRRFAAIHADIREQSAIVRVSALEAVQDQCPVYTGEFRNSIIAEGPNEETHIVSTHQKARQIIEGTQPSPGLWIKWDKKFIGRRLTPRSGRKDIGMHPGTPKHPVFDEALPEIRRYIRISLEKIII